MSRLNRSLARVVAALLVATAIAHPQGSALADGGGAASVQGDSLLLSDQILLGYCVEREPCRDANETPATPQAEDAKTQFAVAIAYLSKSKTARDYFARLRTAKKSLVINVVHNGEDRMTVSKAGNVLILWDPALAAAGGTSSVALVHELGHAVHYMEDPKGTSLDNQTPNLFFDSYEEARTITEVENVVARELGEPQRDRHTVALERVSSADARAHH